MKTLFRAIRLFLAIWDLRDSDTWKCAEEAVSAVHADIPLNALANREERTIFCPRCGQIPDGDRRMDEARLKAIAILDGQSVKRSELDAALALNYWLLKR